MGGKPVAGYGWAKRHCSYHPLSGAVLSELDGNDWGTGTLRFPVDQPLPRQLTPRLIEVKLAYLRSTA